MLLQSQVGAQATNPALGVNTPAMLRSGRLAELIMQELHGRYYETAYNKALFATANQAAVATSAAFVTTYTGLCLSNPIGSTVNLVLNKVGIAQILAQTTTLALGLMTGFNNGTNVTHTTPLTPSNNFVNGPSGQGLVDAAATLPTAPVLRDIFGEIGTAAVSAYGVQPFQLIDLEGSVILPPGGYACVYTNIASVAASLLLSMQWEEVPT